MKCYILGINYLFNNRMIFILFTKTLDGISLEITPSQVIAPPGTLINFTCKYHSQEPLEIIVIEHGRPAFSVDDAYQSYEKGARKSWFTTVDERATIVQCMVRKMDEFVVGLISARVYPGLLHKCREISLMPSCCVVVFGGGSFI